MVEVVGWTRASRSFLAGWETQVMTAAPQDPADSPGFNPGTKPVYGNQFCEGMPNQHLGLWACVNKQCTILMPGGRCRVFPKGTHYECDCTPPGWQRPRVEVPEEVPVPETPRPVPERPRPIPGDPTPNPTEPDRKRPAEDWKPDPDLVVVCVLVVAAIITAIVLSKILGILGLFSWAW